MSRSRGSLSNNEQCPRINEATATLRQWHNNAPVAADVKVKSRRCYVATCADCYVGSCVRTFEGDRRKPSRTINETCFVFPIQTVLVVLFLVWNLADQSVTCAGARAKKTRDATGPSAQFRARRHESNNNTHTYPLPQIHLPRRRLVINNRVQESTAGWTADEEDDLAGFRFRLRKGSPRSFHCRCL